MCQILSLVLWSLRLQKHHLTWGVLSWSSKTHTHSWRWWGLLRRWNWIFRGEWFKESGVHITEHTRLSIIQLLIFSYWKFKLSNIKAAKQSELDKTLGLNQTISTFIDSSSTGDTGMIEEPICEHTWDLINDWTPERFIVISLQFTDNWVTQSQYCISIMNIKQDTF